MLSGVFALVLVIASGWVIGAGRSLRFPIQNLRDAGKFRQKFLHLPEAAIVADVNVRHLMIDHGESAARVEVRV